MKIRKNILSAISGLVISLAFITTSVSSCMKMDAGIFELNLNKEMEFSGVVISQENEFLNNIELTLSVFQKEILMEEVKTCSEEDGSFHLSSKHSNKKFRYKLSVNDPSGKYTGPGFNSIEYSAEGCRNMIVIMSKACID